MSMETAAKNTLIISQPKYLIKNQTIISNIVLVITIFVIYASEDRIWTLRGGGQIKIPQFGKTLNARQLPDVKQFFFRRKNTPFCAL